MIASLEAVKKAVQKIESGGRRMTVEYCTQCGAPLTPGAVSCERCGAQVNPIASSPLTYPTAPQADPYGQPQPAGDSQPTGYANPASSGPVYVDPLVGEAAPNQTYLGSRLLYTDSRTEFDPLTNPVFLRSLAARFFAVVGTWWVGGFLLFLIFGIAGIVQAAHTPSSSYYGSTSSSSTGRSYGLLITWFVLTGVWSLLTASLFWLKKLPTQLSEWMLTVDGKGGVARAALEHMYAIIAARRPPLRTMGVIRLTPPGQPPRDYLQVVDGVYLGFVSSFAYGSDLFIGWTFWLNLSPARWLLMTLARMFKGQGAGLYGGLVYDQPKAMREVMHSAVRQGVDVATGERAPTGQGAIGSTVPIVTVPV